MRCTWLHKGLPRDDGATVVGSVPSLRYGTYRKLSARLLASTVSSLTKYSHRYGIHPQGDYDKDKVPTGCIVSIVSEYIDR